MHSTLSYERAPMSVVDTALVHHHLAPHNSHGLVLCKLEDARAVSEKPSVCLRLTVWSIISRETTTTVLSTTLVPSNQHIPPYFERSTLYQRRLDTYSAMWLCTENNCIFHIPTSKAYHCSSLTACSLFTSPHTHGRKQRWRQQSPCFLRGRYPTFSFYRPNHTTEGNKFYLYGTHLSEFMPMVQDVWKVGVPQICFRFGRLPVGALG